MNIAILYSGAIRTLAESINNNLSYFDGDNIDLYFSTWDHLGYSDRINSPDYIISSRTLDRDTQITSQIICDMVPSNINIKKIKIENYNSNNYNLDIINGLDNNGLSAQYYKIWDCFNLIDNSINYDMIVRLRCDLVLNIKINKEYLKNLVTHDMILFSSKIWYEHVWQAGLQAINEMMWISNKHQMKKACSIYNNIDKINKIIISRNSQEINYGEKICYLNLEAEELLNNIVTFDFDYNVLR